MNSGQQGLNEFGGLPLDRIGTDLGERGVAVVPELVPAALCAAAAAAIRAHKGVDDDPASWYPEAPLENGVVPLHHPQAFWDIRQMPRLYDLFVALLGTPFLWVSMDRGSFKAPFRADHPDWIDSSPFHWDVDPRLGRRRLQGLVYLEDCSEDQGAFQCVPGIFRQPDPWWSVYGLEPFAEERIRDSEIIRVGGRAGTLVVWDARLPHGSGLNRSERPRLALYLTMQREGDDGVRRERIRNFEERRAPAFWRGLPGQLDPEPGHAARLTPLGECLLGRGSW